jgi:hypothetical protein
MTKQEQMYEAMKELAEKYEAEMVVFDESEEDYSVGFDYKDTATVFIELNDTYGPGFVGGSCDCHIPSDEREHYDTIEEAIDHCDNVCCYVDENENGW